MSKSKSKKSRSEELLRAEKEQAMLCVAGKQRKEKEKIVVPIEHDIPQVLLNLSIRPACDFRLKTRSSDRIKQRIELVKHLYVQYPVPKILEQVWYKEQNERNINRNNHRYRREPVKEMKVVRSVFHDWYICAATGGSLHKAHLKDFMTKKESHAFMACSKPLNINRAIYYATALCAGASDGMAFRIAKSKIAEKAYTNTFWRDCARFFAVNHAESVNQINDLVDYLESRLLENREFSIFGQGFTVKTLLERMKNWHYDMRRIKEHSGYTWTGFDIPDRQFMKKDEQGREVIWSITQIVNGKDLAEEGNNMHHCVYSYRPRCISGSVSIWSMRVRPNTPTGHFEEKRVATIEVRNNYIVAQARGFANRDLKSHEKNILAIWCRENNIGYNGSY